MGNQQVTRLSIKSQHGITLIESLVALTLVSTLGTGLVLSMVKSLHGSRTVEHKMEIDLTSRLNQERESVKWSVISAE